MVEWGLPTDCSGDYECTIQTAINMETRIRVVTVATMPRKQLHDLLSHHPYLLDEKVCRIVVQTAFCFSKFPLDSGPLFVSSPFFFFFFLNSFETFSNHLGIVTMARIVAALALLVGALSANFAAAEGSDTYQVKFDLANLDGKKGEYGSFTLEVGTSKVGSRIHG